MPWFLVDDQFPTDDRVLAVSLAARGLWVMAGAWSSAHRTDVVPDHVLTSLGSTPELVSELATARIVRRAKGGYRLLQPGLCKIPLQETVDKQRDMKTDRQRRWRESQRRRNVDASTGPSTWDPLPQPYPDVHVATDTERPSTARAPNPDYSRTANPLNGAAARHPSARTVAEATAAAIPPSGKHARRDDP